MQFILVADFDTLHVNSVNLMVDLIKAGADPGFLERGVVYCFLIV